MAISGGTGVTRSAITDQSGHYILLGLPAGTYEVRAELAGFEPGVRAAQTFSVGSTVTLDMVLKLAGVVARVEVRGGIPILETSKNTLTRLVQSDEIDRLPVINRNFNDLAALAPVVTKTGVYFAGVERFTNESSNVVKSTFASANGTFPSSDGQTLSLAKLDIVASQSHRVRLRYSGQREHTTGSSIGGVSTREHGRVSDVRANDTVGNWTWVVSPTTLNEGRAAWSTSFPAGGCNFATENAPGTWFERSYPGAQFGCPVNFGTIGEDHLQLIENLSTRLGRHDLKLGGQADWTRSFGDFRNLRDGRYSFERDLPFSLTDPSSYPFSFSKIEGPTDWDVAGWSTGMFVQDSWRMTDDFTLGLGVRYDLDGSLTALNPLVRLDKGLHT